MKFAPVKYSERIDTRSGDAHGKFGRVPCATVENWAKAVKILIDQKNKSVAPDRRCFSFASKLQWANDNNYVNTSKIQLLDVKIAMSPLIIIWEQTRSISANRGVLIGPAYVFSRNSVSETNLRRILVYLTYLLNIAVVIYVNNLLVIVIRSWCFWFFREFSEFSTCHFYWPDFAPQSALKCTPQTKCCQGAACDTLLCAFRLWPVWKGAWCSREHVACRWSLMNNLTSSFKFTQQPIYLGFW